MCLSCRGALLSDSQNSRRAVICNAYNGGMNFDLARRKMVVEQLQWRGIADPRVLDALHSVPRHEFVPPELISQAYEDRALPIGLEQTISQPYTVAFMCEAARLRPQDKILEIGTGSGYGAAVLAMLAREVHTVERVEPLCRAARQRLEELGPGNVRVYRDDGALGLPREAPFDAIIVTAGPEALPPAYLEQLADHGRLIIPVGPTSAQTMFRITREGDHFTHEDLGHFGFVPLIPGKPST